jgi:hypothetical protein
VTAVSLPNGSKASREYRRRYEILREFDPEHDLRADPGQGLVFNDCAEELKEDVRRYMYSRLA